MTMLFCRAGETEYPEKNYQVMQSPLKSKGEAGFAI